ncbi:MAG: glycosyltransferase [Kofleriaceae bacterium]
MSHALEELHEGVRDLDMYRVLGAVRDTVGAFVTAVPYLFAVDHFARQRKQARDVVAAWQASPRPPQVACLAIFSDSIDHVDGVTSSLRRFVREATREGRNVRIPYCGARPVDANDVVYRPLAAVLSETTTLYADLELHVPSLLDTIDWLWRNNITHVELATPGPMGLVGLIAARLLRLPVTASYHTEVLKLLSQLSNSALLHKAASALTTWFYKTVDKVFAFSESSRQSLLQLGVPSARIEHVSVAIDPHEFSPAYAEATAFGALGIDVECERVILTVGRLSREKRVDVIIEAIDRIQNTPRAPVLVIVGDGPERAALERLAAGKAHVVFVGVQRGDTLKRLYASASAFVFASRIDTLGLATMEAMASGIPVIVPADSAIAELVVADRSGYCYEFGVDGLVEVLIALDESPQHRRSVAESARKAMVARWDQTRFSDLWQRMAGTTSSEA